MAYAMTLQPLAAALIGGVVLAATPPDFAGRVFKAVPAPTNLKIPPHCFQSDTLVEIGVDPQSTTA